MTEILKEGLISLDPNKTNELPLHEGRELIAWVRVARTGPGLIVEIKRISGQRAYTWVPFLGITCLNNQVMFGIMGPRGELREGEIDVNTAVKDKSTRG